MNAQIYSFDPACQTECDRDEIFFGKADGLVQRRKTLFFAQSEGKSSMGRPERSAAKSKGDEVGAPGSARGDPLFTVKMHSLDTLFYVRIKL